jgi:hypothetical protein
MFTQTAKPHPCPNGGNRSARSALLASTLCHCRVGSAKLHVHTICVPLLLSSGERVLTLFRHSRVGGNSCLSHFCHPSESWDPVRVCRPSSSPLDSSVRWNDGGGTCSPRPAHKNTCGESIGSINGAFRKASTAPDSLQLRLARARIEDATQVGRPSVRTRVLA